MKSTLLGQVLLASLVGAGNIALASTPEELLSSPLIVGASVSAGSNGVDSPGKNLALRYTENSKIRTIAANGRTARENMKRINAKDIKDRSLIIGIDLFFWDATRSTPEQSLPALQKIIQMSTEKKVPLVLGDIPELLPSQQPHLKVLNQEIQAACRKSAYCALVPLYSVHRKALQDGFIMYRGKRYRPEELLPDGLHLSPLASDFLADQISAALFEKRYFRPKKATAKGQFISIFSKGR